MKKTTTAIVSCSALMASMLLLKPENIERFHSDDELKAIRHMKASGPYGVNDLFAGAGLCIDCHGHDADNFAMVTSWGQDVNTYDEWAGTMMANSAKDPFWRAKVSHEILVNPSLSTEIQTTCTSCHAPQGHFNALHNGATSYTMANLAVDSIGRDGVSCGACHQQKDTLLGKRFSGQLIYDTTKTIFGPYTSPFVPPMLSNINFNVAYGPHIAKAGLCAACHTLITDSHDLAGNPTGTKFVEQATYHEWLNSIYNDEDTIGSGISCAGCHMPRINEPIVISSNYPFLPGRQPYGQHHLVGANSFMIQLMKNNIAALGITTTAAKFDSAFVRTNRQLRDSTVDMTLTLVNRTVDTAFYELKLTNKAGHKFPSGYPSRRSYVQFILMDDSGDTLFKNGMLNSSYQLIGQDASFEPHHQMINNENDVQIYEMVPGDVNGDVTTVLERAFSMLKDNRLAPKGFKTSHNAYDTVKIVGSAETDPDFNYDASMEGSGTDVIHFHIPLAGYTGDLNVSTSLFYQSVPHKWLEEMFTYSSTDINAFQTMYNAADHTPVLVAHIEDGNIFTSIHERELISAATIYPNPSTTGTFYIQGGKKPEEIIVYSISGKKELALKDAIAFTLNRKGTYVVRIRFGSTFKTEKIIFR